MTQRAATAPQSFRHGLLAGRAMEQYLELMRPRARRVDASVTSSEASALCSAWGGFGGQLILSHHLNGRVTDAQWSRLERAVALTRHTDLFLGVAGTLPVLALVAKARGKAGRRLTELAARRTTQTLKRMLAGERRGRPVWLGFAHGVAGLLSAHEIGNALLGEASSEVRGPAIELLLRAATVLGSGAAVWSLMAHTPRSPKDMHSLCNGGPGIGLGATLAFRYSRDEAYAPLIQLAMTSVATRSENETFCCGTLGRVEMLIEVYRTTRDVRVLELAKTLFASVDASLLTGATWRQGTLGYQFTQLRLARPLKVDLPGFPLQVSGL